MTMEEKTKELKLRDAVQLYRKEEKAPSNSYEWYRKSAQQLIDIYKQLDELIQIDLKNTNKLFQTSKVRALKEEEIANNQRLINELKSKLNSNYFNVEFFFRRKFGSRDLTESIHPLSMIFNYNDIEKNIGIETALKNWFNDLST